MSEPTLRPITVEEFPAYYGNNIETFNSDPRDAERELEFSVIELERTLGGFVDKELVATACIYSRSMTVPGGPLPVAAVSMVSVAATHRRQGLLTAMMRRQLTELHEQQGEPVAALWASEAPIYGRYGYGIAAQGMILTGRTPALRFRPGVDTGGGRVRMAAEHEARPHLESVYEAVRVRQPGLLDRAGAWWSNRLSDLEYQRQGGTTLRFALWEEPGGEVSGYALYRTKQEWGDQGPDGELMIREVMAANPRAYAGLWAFLLERDLVRRVSRHTGPVDEPLVWLVDDPRQLALRVQDQLWVRLADVGRALAARAYTTEIDVVLEVSDPFCPWNARRWRLSGGPGGAVCEPTSAPADLSLSSAELGGAYLGGPTLSSYAAAGRVEELRPGALTATSIAFRGDRLPWCPEIF